MANPCGKKWMDKTMLEPMLETIHIECKAKELMLVLNALAEEMYKIGITTMGEYQEYLGRLD